LKNRRLFPSILSLHITEVETKSITNCGQFCNFCIFL